MITGLKPHGFQTTRLPAQQPKAVIKTPFCCLTVIRAADTSFAPTPMKLSFQANASENHASALAVAESLVARLNLVLTSRLASVLPLVVVIITITPGGVR